MKGNKKVTFLITSTNFKIAGLEMRNTRSGSARKMIIQLIVPIFVKRLV